MPEDIQLVGKLLELDRNYKTSEIVTGAAGRNVRGVAVTEDRRGDMNSKRGDDSSNSRQTSDNDNDDEDGGSGGRAIAQSSRKRKDEKGDDRKAKKYKLEEIKRVQ